jgi:hypothetical protein
MAWLLWCASVLSACTPALDWRDVRPEGSSATLQFPCRPVVQRRQVGLAGPPVLLSLQACSAGDQTFALAMADMGDPARIGPALTELASSATANLGAGAAASAPLQVAGATPHPAAVRSRLAGSLPDGQPAQMQVAVFTQGTHVFQATVLGTRLDADAADTFFASIRFGR